MKHFEWALELEWALNLIRMPFFGFLISIFLPQNLTISITVVV